jgi:hypothetical protein
MNRIVIVLAVVLLSIAPAYAAAPTPTATPPPTPTVITGEFWDDMSGPTTAGKADKEDKWGAVYHENGQLHVVAKKQVLDNGDWHRDFGVMRFYPAQYGDMTLDIDVGRISGSGFGAGMADIIFGYQDENNFYGLQIARAGAWWMVAKKLGGKKELINIIPGGPLDKWDKGRTIHEAAVPAGDAWDHFKIVVQGQNDGTWIGVYANDTLLGFTKDTDYRGGAFALGCYTYDNEAHVVYDNLHITPTGNHL